jgi:radical SAM superfamily enzyme YgiQ (UPF0313 family)
MKEITDFSPDLICLSIITTEYPRASELVRALKQEVPKAVFCADGVHPSALPVETMYDLGLDFVVLGEGG